MRYYKTELWRHHSDVRKRVKIILLGVAFLILGIGWISYTFWLANQLPPSPWSVMALPAALITLVGAITTLAGWDRAKDRITALAVLMGSGDSADIFAMHTREGVREQGRILLLNQAYNIKVLEMNFAEANKVLSTNDMLTLLTAAVDDQKRIIRSRMDRLYNALLEFRLANPGGLGQYFDELG